MKNRCVETIKVCGRKLFNLPYHQARMDRTRSELYGCPQSSGIMLEEILTHRLPDTEALLKCRVEYDTEIRRIEFLPYKTPVIHRLKKVFDNDIHYKYKFAERGGLERLHALAAGYDDALIIRDGLITDTTFCNVALFDGYHWLTPADPLLRGTKRQELLDHGMLIEKNIPAGWIPEFQAVALFNAMNDFGSLLVPVSEIY